MKRMKSIVSVVLTIAFCIGSFCTIQTQASAANEDTATTEHYQVTVYATYGEGLALRSQPDADAQVSLMIPEDTLLKIDGTNGNWGYTTYQNTSGWVHLRYTKIVGYYPTLVPTRGYINPTYYTVYNTDGEGLELRVDPGSQCSTFGALMDDTVILAEARLDDWVFTAHNGHYGWMNISYLRESTPEEIARYDSLHRSYASWKEAYAAQLMQDRIQIENYDWQMGFYAPYSVRTPENLARQIAICDISGDEIPELIYITVNTSAANAIAMPEIHMMTFADGQVRTIYEDNWDKPMAAGGYYYYYLFQCSDGKTLWACVSSGDDGGEDSYLRFEEQSDGSLLPETVYRKNYYPDGTLIAAGNGNYYRETYYDHEVETAAEIYLSNVAALQQETARILLYNQNCSEFAIEYANRNGSTAMTMDEALAVLAE